MVAKTNRKTALTTTEAAVLGVLTWGPMSGYDLKKAIDSSVGYFWGPAKSGIYALLPRLAESGLATSRQIAQSGRPDKRVYRITARGRAALRTWIRTHPPLPIPIETHCCSSSSSAPSRRRKSSPRRSASAEKGRAARPDPGRVRPRGRSGRPVRRAHPDWGTSTQRRGPVGQEGRSGSEYGMTRPKVRQSR